MDSHFVTTAQRTLQISAFPIDNLSSTLITLLTPILLRLASTLNQLHMEMSRGLLMVFDPTAQLAQTKYQQYS